eukprot:scaffold15871_cov18-Prasinocladus_malaysianus.AAC.1
MSFTPRSRRFSSSHRLSPSSSRRNTFRRGRPDSPATGPGQASRSGPRNRQDGRSCRGVDRQVADGSHGRWVDLPEPVAKNIFGGVGPSRFQATRLGGWLPMQGWCARTGPGVMPLPISVSGI